MSGLGAVNENNSKFLSIAGGFIWDRKAEQNDPNYATQEFQRADGTTGERQGARYADLTGTVTNVVFRVHQQYGESVNVTVNADQDYIVSISTNNRYSQDMMKALLKMDFDKTISIKPYDFVGQDKKRAQGISFKQDGQKLDLKVDDAPQAEADFFKTATTKQIKRFFEDLSEWYVNEVTEKVIPILDAKAPVKNDPKKQDEEQDNDFSEEEENKKEELLNKAREARSNKVENPKSEEKPEEEKVTPLRMKKFVQAYIDENYEGETLPMLTKLELERWYKLAKDMEELPFDEEENEAEHERVSDSDLDKQLDELLG